MWGREGEEERREGELGDSLEHLSTWRYSPHAVSPQWSQYSGLLWGMETGLKSWLCTLGTTSVLSVKFGCASKGSWYFVWGKFISTGATEYAVPFFFLSFFFALLIFKVSLTLANADSPAAGELDSEPEPFLPFCWGGCLACKLASFLRSMGFGDSVLKGPPLFFLALPTRLGEPLRGEACPFTLSYTFSFFPLPLGRLCNGEWLAG